MLENMGLKVIAERPYGLEFAGGRRAWIQDLELVMQGAAVAKFEALESEIKSAFTAVWTGRMDSDSFNQLTLIAGVPWRIVTVLRAYCRYLLQTGLPFSQGYIAQVLVEQSRASRACLADLFVARFDPDDLRRRPAQRAHAARPANPRQARGGHALRRGSDPARPVECPVGHGAHQRLSDRGGRPVQGLSVLQDRKPEDARAAAAEADVRGVRVLDAHGRRAPAHGLRRARRHPLVGPARGLPHRGTRPDEGAAGQEHGDRARRRQGRLRRAGACIAGDREAQQAEVDRLLPDADPRDCWIITDNIVDDKIVAPARVVRHDGDDAYLVVAADKGTATFSDIANAISEEYGFWLGDAFASGGSAGYDHKKMAITARGAWECVKRHFREIGMDIQNQDFSVAGIGDMAGDVFGNGMLQSPHIRLIAAFNHQHIFFDPQPDAARSFKRARAAVPLAALLLGGLLAGGDLQGRRRVLAQRQEPDAVARSPDAARTAARRSRRTK